MPVGQDEHGAERGDGGAPEFFFDVRTRQVTQGRTTGWADRMGPYPSRVVAEHALEQARARSRAWDEDDARE